MYLQNCETVKEKFKYEQLCAFVCGVVDLGVGTLLEVTISVDKPGKDRSQVAVN